MMLQVPDDLRGTWKTGTIDLDSRIEGYHEVIFKANTIEIIATITVSTSSDPDYQVGSRMSSGEITATNTDSNDLVRTIHYIEPNGTPMSIMFTFTNNDKTAFTADGKIFTKQ